MVGTRFSLSNNQDSLSNHLSLPNQDGRAWSRCHWLKSTGWWDPERAFLAVVTNLWNIIPLRLYWTCPCSTSIWDLKTLFCAWAWGPGHVISAHLNIYSANTTTQLPRQHIGIHYSNLPLYLLLLLQLQLLESPTTREKYLFLTTLFTYTHTNSNLHPFLPRISTIIPRSLAALYL